MAIHYASNIGTASWVNSTNILTPCSVETAMANAASDTVYLRGGTYQIGPAPVSESAAIAPALSGAAGNPTIFINFPDEIPIFNGTIAGSANWGTNGNIGCIVLGAHNVEHIVFDGIHLQCDSGLWYPQLYIGDTNEQKVGTYWYDPVYYTTSNITARRMKFIAPAAQNPGTDNAAAIYMKAVETILIEHNDFPNFKGSSLNFSTISCYGGHNVTVRNNEFDNTYSCIFMKSGNYNWDIYDNFFHDMLFGVTGRTENFYCNTAKVHNNIFYNYSQGAIVYWNYTDVANYYPAFDDIKSYNNTYYPGIAASDTGFGALVLPAVNAVGFELYNSVFKGVHNGYGMLRFDNDFSADILDYNLYDSSDFYCTIDSVAQTSNYSTYLGWTIMGLDGGANEHDANSINGTVTFTNGNGDYSEPSDFQLDSGSDGLNAGNDGNDMGANVTTVGIQLSVENTIAASAEPATASVTAFRTVNSAITGQAEPATAALLAGTSPIAEIVAQAQPAQASVATLITPNPEPEPDPDPEPEIPTSTQKHVYDDLGLFGDLNDV